MKVTKANRKSVIRKLQAQGINVPDDAPTRLVRSYFDAPLPEERPVKRKRKTIAVGATKRHAPVIREAAPTARTPSLRLSPAAMKHIRDTLAEEMDSGDSEVSPYEIKDWWELVTHPLQNDGTLVFDDEWMGMMRGDSYEVLPQIFGPLEQGAPNAKVLAEINALEKAIEEADEGW